MVTDPSGCATCKGTRLVPVPGDSRSTNCPACDPPKSKPDQSVAVATGDFNHPEFLSRPSRAVEVGERVLCHDCDRTVDDYWGVVRAVHPPRTLHSPDAEKTYPYGLIHVEVKRKVPMPRELLEAAAQAHLRSCRQRGSSWTRLLDEDYEAIIDAYRDHELCGSLFTCESCRAASDEVGLGPEETT